MNCAELPLLFLISISQITPVKSVKRFKMKSCTRARNVNFVFGIETERLRIESRFFYYKKLTSHFEKYNSGIVCFNISLTFITPDNIFKVTGNKNELALLEEMLNFEEEEKRDFSKYFEFLDQYEKEINDSQDKMLIFFLDWQSVEVIRKLNELRKYTHVVLMDTLPLHYLQLTIFHPEWSSSDLTTLNRDSFLVFLYLFSKRNTDKAFEYFRSHIELIHNPQFDRFKFIEETPYEKNTTCLRNTTIVWVVGNSFGYSTNFQLFILYEHFLVFTKTLNLNFYTLRPSRRDKANGKTPKTDKRYVKNISLIIDKDELLTDILKLGNNTTVLPDGISGKVVFIIDTYSINDYQSIVASLSARKESCFVELKSMNNLDKSYRKKNILYFDNRESNPYVNVDLLFDALIDAGCKK